MLPIFKLTFYPIPNGKKVYLMKSPLRVPCYLN